MAYDFLVDLYLPLTVDFVGLLPDFFDELAILVLQASKVGLVFGDDPLEFLNFIAQSTYFESYITFFYCRSSIIFYFNFIPFSLYSTWRTSFIVRRPCPSIFCTTRLPFGPGLMFCNYIIFQLLPNTSLGTTNCLCWSWKSGQPCAVSACPCSGAKSPKG